MLLQIFIAVPTVIIYLFLFWRRLKEDYSSQSIFTSSFYILFSIVIFYLISIYYFPEWWFWFCFLGAGIGMQISKIKFDFKLSEIIDASVMALNTLVFSVFFYAGSARGDLSLYLVSLISLLLYFVFWIVDRNYKRLSWYRSGKIGFSGLFTIGLYFLSRSAIAIYFPDMLSFVGKADAVFSATTAFIAFLGLFNLSRQVE